MTHTPRKRFGQNFLIDGHIITEILAAINPQPGQHFLEIGPGTGALTQGLVNSKAKIDAVEIDRDLAQILLQEYSADKNFTLHIEDVLKFSISSIKDKQKLRVVGNLPYNISTPLLFKLFADIENISDMYFMLQYEVAERLCAKPNSKTYGRLSVMAQYYCDMHIIIDVPPESFSPPPKVDSCIVQFIPHVNQQIKVPDIHLLHDIVTQAFSQRRKTIANSLKQFIDSTRLQELNISPKLRAENLSLSDFANITTLVSKG